MEFMYVGSQSDVSGQRANHNHGQNHFNRSQKIQRKENIAFQKKQAELMVMVVKALQLYQKQVIEKKHLPGNDIQEKWYRQIRHDLDLGYPHKKIMEYLIGIYDPIRKEHKPVNFSKLVKETKIGKNMAQGYLTFLLNKKYIKTWSDGYRTFYQLADNLPA